MVSREEITSGWRGWDRQRLAFALEAHLIPKENWPVQTLPTRVRECLDSDPIAGLAYHEYTGYVVMWSAGQGPVITHIERE